MDKSIVKAKRKVGYTVGHKVEWLGLAIWQEKAQSPKRMDHEVLGRGHTMGRKQYLLSIHAMARLVGVNLDGPPEEEPFLLSRDKPSWTGHIIEKKGRGKTGYGGRRFTIHPPYPDEATRGRT